MQPVDRHFYSIDSSGISKSHFHAPPDEKRERLVGYVAESVIGQDKIFSGPFGLRKVLYLDYIASGRALSFVEDYIQDEVLPEYGNTHTTTSVTSLQTTLFRHEARDIIRNAVNASEHDAVIFTGSGCTGAIHKLIHALSLTQSPVVLVGPFEHYSNILPWKETGAKVIRVKQTLSGQVDIQDLEQKLQEWSGSGRQLIGSFSAASNVTGILADVDTITICLHKHNALAFWDYATAAPYVKLDMNPVVPGKDSAFVYKDAMFISPHKFVGGVSTPGVLVAKKNLFKNVVPEKGGGGTVFFVRRDAHRYLREPELREEGGTPAIVGAIRAGLVFQLKSAITPEVIMAREQQLFRQAKEAWQSVPNLVILGNLDTERLPVFSFIIHHPQSGFFLHYNYISALLNDLFGIQVRGGCACAGPYAMDLLGITEERAEEIEHLLAEDGRLDRVHLRRYKEYSHREIIRPGFTRLNLPYFMLDEELQFVLKAVAMVAEHGWKLLPQYMFNPETGEWRQKEQQVFKERKWLGHISYAANRMEYAVPKPVAKGPLPESLQDCLAKARQVFAKAEKSRIKLPDHTQMFDEAARHYRWFILPSEANEILSGNWTGVPRSPCDLSFCPTSLRERLVDKADTMPVDSSAGEPSLRRNSYDASQKEDNFGEKNTASCGGEHRGEKGFGEEFEGDDCSDTSAGRAEHNATLQTEVDEAGDGDSRKHCPCAGEFISGSAQADQAAKSVHATDKAVLGDNLNCVAEGELEDFTQAVQYFMERGYDCGSPACSIPTLSTELNMESQQSAQKVHGHSEQTAALTPSDSLSPAAEVVVRSKNAFRKSPELGHSAKLDGEIPNTAATLENNSSTTCKLSEASPSSKYSDTPPSSQNSDSQLNGKVEPSTQEKQKKKKETKPSVEKKLVANIAEQGKTEKKKDKGGHWFAPPKEIFKEAVKAMEEFAMVNDGDRVLVCLSGGKDSLSLLHTMHQYQFFCRSKGISFELGAVTVDPQTPSFDPSPLKDYLAMLGVPYFYESQCIMETAMKLPYECASICSFCSRMKRGRIYAAARREGYNVLALGQHLDDLAESFMMSLFHNGSLRTMKAHYTVLDGDLRVIRPFVYVREKDLRSFAEKNKLPVIAENCPACFEAPKERHRTKQLLASQEILFPRIYSSILSAIKPVMALSRTGTNVADSLTASDSQWHRNGGVASGAPAWARVSPGPPSIPTKL